MTIETQPRIAYDKVGDGRTALLCLPGWAAERTMFRNVLSGLARTTTAVALDWRGHGGSEIPTDDFGGDDLVEDALSVISGAGLERVVPVAQAHAGWVALELRRRLGSEKIPGVVLCSWSVLGPPPPLAAALPSLQRRATWEQTMTGLVGMWTAGVSDPEVLSFVRSMEAYGFEMWARAGREIAKAFEHYGSPVASLQSLPEPCPTLHVYAQPLDDAYLEAQRSFGASNPWFEVRRVPGASHFPTIESPEEVVVAIEDFVAKLSV